MSTKAQNFANLCKGNPVSTIIRALNLTAPSVKEELMKEYKANSIENLAIKLS